MRWFGDKQGGSSWPLVVVGGGGGDVMVFDESLERMKSENRVFHTRKLIYNLQISLGKLVFLSETPLLALSTTFHAERITSSGWNCA